MRVATGESGQNGVVNQRMDIRNVKLRADGPTLSIEELEVEIAGNRHHIALRIGSTY